MTFFGSADPPFQSIPDDKRLLTEPFLKASRYILPIFDKFGASFKIVKSDVSGNIEKINKKYQQNPEKYKTLNDILEEGDIKGDKVLKDAHIGAVWLTRGLNFIQEFLVVMVADYEGQCNREGNCSDLILKAYAETLCKHHGVIMRNVFKPICKLAPTKPVFLKTLKHTEDVSDDQVIADMKEYQKVLAAIAVVVQEAVDTLGVQG